jgi:small subunit ribosomal protein S1
VLPHVYRVTKYDPTDRDEHGHYTGPEETLSDRGVVETAYLRAVEAFASDAGIDRLWVREPQVPSLTNFGVVRPLEDFGLDGLFPAGLAGFHDGAEVPLEVGLALVRVMLRDSGAWCRLEVEGAFAVHVGWDQYLYLGSDRPCEEALARTRALGLFPERLDASPYDMETDGEDVQRPGDDDFWAGVHWAVATGRAGILEETYSRAPHDGTTSPTTPLTWFAPGSLPAPVWPCGRPCPLTLTRSSAPFPPTVSSKVCGRTRTAGSTALSPPRTSSRSWLPG